MFGNKEAEYRVFLDAVRAEIRAGVEPLGREIGGVKEAVERVEAAQKDMYTKEVMDLKLKERDDHIAALEAAHAGTSARVNDLSARLGGFWKQAFITGGIVLGPIGALLAIILNWHNLLSLFH